MDHCHPLPLPIRLKRRNATLSLGPLLEATFNELSKGELGDQALTEVEFSEPVHQSTTDNADDINVSSCSIVTTVLGMCNSQSGKACHSKSTLLGTHLRNRTSSTSSFKNIAVPTSLWRLCHSDLKTCNPSRATAIRMDPRCPILATFSVPTFKRACKKAIYKMSQISPRFPKRPVPRN